jgi:Protein of unknown function (DUF3631)/Domain of unknown function (DUF3854)
MISDDHATLLTAAAIDLDVARRAGVESVTEVSQLPEELRWLAGQEHGLPGLLFWWRDLEDRHVPQYRPDEAVTLNGKPCKYLFAKDARPPVWVHPVMAERLDDPRSIVIVEGTKQCLAAVSVAGDDVLVVGIVGCSGWMHEGVPHADLARLPVENRDVVTIFDADLATNRAVWDNAARLGAHLEVLGARGVRHVQLPASRSSGLDDYLGAVPADRRPAVFERLVAAAGKLPRTPARPKGETGAEDPHPAPEDTFEDVLDEAGAPVLTDLADFLARHVAFPSPEARDAVVLWVAHTWTVDAFDSTPRLALLSPERRCGKTRVLELVEMLSHAARFTVSMSPSYLFRSVEQFMPTLLLDEADNVFGGRGADTHADLRALINAGHRRGATVGRIIGDGAAMTPAEFSVFAPVALASKGDHLPDTVLDRSVIVRMRRRAPNETVEPLRRKRAEARAAKLARRLAAWAYRHGDEVTDVDPAMPEGVVDRAADVWEPLLAIADAAGGDWPKRAHDACGTLTTGGDDGDGSGGVRLLADVRGIFDTTKTKRSFSATLVEKLNALDESPWSSWHRDIGLKTVDLAAILRTFGVRSKTIRIGSLQRKGYERDDFADAFARYLDPESDPGSNVSVPPSQNGEHPENMASDLGWDAGTAGTADSVPSDMGRQPGPAEPSPPSRRRIVFNADGTFTEGPA